MRGYLLIIRWKHGRALALMTGDYLAIEPCGISSSLLVGNTAGLGMFLCYLWETQTGLGTSDW